MCSPNWNYIAFSAWLDSSFTTNRFKVFSTEAGHIVMKCVLCAVEILVELNADNSMQTLLLSFLSKRRCNVDV